MFSVLQKNTYFYGEFYVHLLCEFFVVLNYDEMNYNLVSRVFYNVFWSVDFSYMDNHESNVGMNYSVKFVET
jgi:hypothetical protein